MRSTASQADGDRGSGDADAFTFRTYVPPGGMSGVFAVPRGMPLIDFTSPR